MNPEDLISDALHDRVERTDYPSTPLSAVAGRAGAIRARRRRTTFLAAAAALAVVAVPGAVWLGRSPGASPQPGHELSSGPTTAPSTAPASVDLTSIPLGHKPGIDYLEGDTYVTMNGDRITSPVFQRATTGTPVRGGILAAETPSAGSALFDLTLVSGTHAQQLGCGSQRFAMSTDGTQSAYWLADSCGAPRGGGKLYTGLNNTMGESGPGYVATPPGVVEQPAGFVRQGVLINDVAGAQGPRLVHWDGTTTTVPLLQVVSGADENNDVMSGVLASSTTTSAVVDASTGAVKWRVDGWDLGQFSDDGKYVIAQNLDGSESYAIFDAITGHKVASLDTIGDNVGIGGPVWDFNDTLLAVASDGHNEAIVRFDLNGHPTRATEVRPVSGVNDVYRLATRP